jgi:hypothetical protein
LRRRARRHAERNSSLPAGRPVAGATVAASRFEQNLDTLTTATSASGRYSFELPDGDWVVCVDAEGYEMAIEAARTGEPLDFRLEPLTPQGARKPT